MKPSPKKEVCDMYESTADSYAEMMDKEIDLPVYADVLGRLHERLGQVPGTLIDTACGSGHMLSMYHDRYDGNRALVGVDLSPNMVSIAGKMLGKKGRIMVGDMCQLSALESGSAAAVLNFFAIHHLDPEGVQAALEEWRRVLRSGGQLLIAAWEGEGEIDYGDEADIVALRYLSHDLSAWAKEAGFTVLQCKVEPVEDFPMDAIYLEGVKE